MSISAEHGSAQNTLPQRTLLIVTPYFPPVLGGLEQYAFRLASQLQQRYHWRVLIATSGNRGTEYRREIFNGLTVYRLGYSWKISNTPLSGRWPHQMRSLIDRENPDLINVHLPVPGLADVAAYIVRDIPLVVTYHTISMHKGNVRYDFLIWLYERLFGRGILSKAKRIICSSCGFRNS